MNAKRDSIPVTTLPNGIPTYTGRHGKFVWPETFEPTVLLHDDFDLLWVQRGAATLEIPDGTKLDAGPGEVLLLPPLVAATIDEAARPLIFWYCHFDFRASSRREVGLIPVPMHIPRCDSSRITKAYQRLNAVSSTSQRPEWHRESALIELITALAQARGKTAQRSISTLPKTPHDPRIVLIRQKIESNPAATWRVSELAAGAKMSVSHLHELWHRTFGRSVKSYLIRARLKQAVSMLQYDIQIERKSIKEIAIACGFSSQHLFSRQFRKAFGVTPSGFRNSAGF